MNLFDDKALQWNVHTKGIWVGKKDSFLQRIHTMTFNQKDFPVPAHVAFDIEHYIKDATAKNGIDPRAVIEIAYNDDKAKDRLYGIRCKYADCLATIYLHSNTKVVSVIAVMKTPHIQLIK